MFVLEQQNRAVRAKLFVFFWGDLRLHFFSRDSLTLLHQWCGVLISPGRFICTLLRDSTLVELHYEQTLSVTISVSFGTR